jgi:hypothetical protein
MSERRSAEPWSAIYGLFGDGGGRYDEIADATGEVVCGEYGPVEEDARRIVACVNACAGTPTEALEQGVLARALDILVEARPLPSEQCLEYDRECLNCRWIEVLRSLGRLPSTDDGGSKP